MKVLILLFAMFLGFNLALKDALSGLNYTQEVIYLNQNEVPAPSFAQDSTLKQAPLHA